MRKFCASVLTSIVIVTSLGFFHRGAEAQSLNVVVYIDAARVLSHFSMSAPANQASALLKANSEIKRFAETYGIDVIFQRATYVSPRVDVTDKFLGFVGGKSLEPVDVSPSGIRVAFVDSKKLFTEAGRRGFKSTEDAARRLNVAISQLAQEEGIDLVFDNAVWANRAIDISEKVLLRFF